MSAAGFSANTHLFIPRRRRLHFVIERVMSTSSNSHIFWTEFMSGQISRTGQASGVLPELFSIRAILTRFYGITTISLFDLCDGVTPQVHREFLERVHHTTHSTSKGVFLVPSTRSIDVFPRHMSIGVQLDISLLSPISPAGLVARTM
jgi:hypothetical protein